MTAQESKLSADEIALYDRQIRLWGIDAQTRIRSSKILLINLSSAGVEICKNLMLSGIGQLTISDDLLLKEESLDTNFFVNSAQIGEPVLKLSFDKIKELNPRVDLQIEYNSSPLSLPREYYQKFDLIIATEINKEEFLRLNEFSRLDNIPVYYTGLHGLYGFIFVDLVSHVATAKLDVTTLSLAKKLGPMDSVRELISSERKKENDQLIDIMTIKNIYKPFKEIGGLSTVAKLKEFFNTKRKLNRISIILPSILTLLEYYPLNNYDSIDDIDIKYEDFEPKLRATLELLGLTNLKIDQAQVSNFLRQAFTQFQPTGAIIGGAVAQDVIQYLSGKQCFNNFVILDALESKMPIYVL